jgi:DNA repair protein RadA/Sms
LVLCDTKAVSGHRTPKVSLKRTSATVYVCQNCGHQSGKWLGKCPECGEWNSLVEERAQPANKAIIRSLFQRRELEAVAFQEIEPQADVRISSGVTEFDRVLGGGIVPGTLVLIGGDPGIGKSTLLLQVADRLSARDNLVLYVSGEESEKQIKLRGERLNIEASTLYILPETNLENIFREVDRLAPAALIIDSIQTVFSAEIESAAGSVSQVREVAHQFLMLAKSRAIPVFLIGHITKEGSIAGPKTLEHIVDTVLYFEGERHHNHRIVRATKNRFGAANEVGVFEMTGAGLVPVANPSRLFLQERPENVAGSVVTACMEGTRPLLVEVQALVSGTRYGTGKRMTQGVDQNRVALLIAMLEKRVGLQLLGDDVFVNIAGGLAVDEPAADLGVVAAIASSFKNASINPHTAVFGEIGLTGEVRGTTQPAVRAREAQALGFQRIVMPYSSAAGLEQLGGVTIIGVRSVEEAMAELF